MKNIMNEEEQKMWDACSKNWRLKSYIGVRIHPEKGAHYILSFKQLWIDYTSDHVKEQLLQTNWSRGFSDHANRLKDGRG
jgi:hypothetical protein